MLLLSDFLSFVLNIVVSDGDTANEQIQAMN